MATDLAEILTALRTEAAHSPRHVPAAAADARTALSRFRPALDRLRDDGLDTGASIDADPDAFSRQADRVHWVRLLAGACDTLAPSVQTTGPSGRLTNLADAAGVAATLHADVLTSNERWTIVGAIARTAHHLTAAAIGGNESAEASRALIIAEASSSVLFQFASLDPPAVAGSVALYRPVPNPSARPTSFLDAALEASAGLVHTTRPGTGPHPIADILAIATAADTACRSVERSQLNAGDDNLARAASDAARAWSEVRDQLAPFNDGSRRPHAGRPPAVHHALALHRAMQAVAGAPQSGPPLGNWVASMGPVLDRLATVAGRLDDAVVDGVASGRIMAYAVDLAVRESWVRPFLQGRRAAGLVTAVTEDLSSVQSTLREAQVRTAALGARVASQPPAVHAGRDLPTDLRPPTRLPSMAGREVGSLPTVPTQRRNRDTSGSTGLNPRR